MRLPTSQAARWALIVAGGCLLLVALNVWWVATYRHGYPFDVDEAGYTSIALIDYLSLKGAGLHGWWEAVQNQTPNAPLLPAVTSLVMVIKAGVLEGFGVLIGFLVLLVFATYGIGERLAGPRLGALAALVVGTSEGAFLFTREYIFALPTAALLACAVFAVLRSDGMRSRRWAIAAGAALGLMLLARTMAVAFVPGVYAAALLAMLARERTELGKRFLNLGLLTLTGVAVAATWYVKNLQPVLDYLTGFGYGAQSAYYGEQHSVVSWGRFKSVAERMIASDLLVPLAAAILLGLAALLVLALRRLIASEDRRGFLLRLAGSDVFGVSVVFIAGFAALMSSQNGGNGFTFPIAMLLPPVALVALCYFRAATIPAVAVLLTISALNVAATSSLWDDLSRPRSVEVPVFGWLPWVSGTPHAVQGIRDQVPGPETRFVARDEGWLAADRALATMLVPPDGSTLEPPVTAFASRNRAISSNSVGLASLLVHNRSIPFTQLQAEPTDTVANYERQLAGPDLGEPTVLVTMNRNDKDFDPLVTQSYAEAAARHLGFRRIRQLELPDGRLMRVWVKRGATALSGRWAPSAAAPAAPARGSRRG
ncbi:MAG TPA: hypothetical protein VHQ43_07675 [Solirubrobacterales bacterium]|nr:hypothetical protein [Solirubrobacterales bacterium]